MIKKGIYVLAILISSFVAEGCMKASDIVQGPAGVAGPKGDTGATGPKGDVGAIGPKGDAGQTGAKGDTGVQGPAGATGNTGAQGPVGLSGTIITLVQFCPNFAPKYPNTFPEVGLCINNKIYAVYSANDGFLTEIPEGIYNSNAVGSNCTFTVLPDCKVQ